MSGELDWTNGVVAIISRDYRPVGTGFVISSEGLIITCAHVLDQTGWPFEGWDSPVEVRFKATGRSTQAFVLEGCYRSQIDGDMVVLELETALPEGVEVLPLAAAQGIEGHKVRMWGYPKLGQEGLGGNGEVVTLVLRGKRSKIQIESTNTTRGYSGGPVWDPAWGRVVGMILEAPDPKADALGRHPYTNFAAPSESLVQLCLERLALTPPISLAAEATRHISGAVEDLVDGYTERIFVGRDEYIEKLNSWVSENSSGRMVITAPAGYGKTALLANWIRHRQAQDDIVAAHFFSNRSDVLRLVSNAYANLLGQLSDIYGLYDETLPSESALPARLRALIEGYSTEPDHQLVILLDALDEADVLFQPSFLPYRLPDGVYLVVSARAGEQGENGDWPRYLEGWTDGAAFLHLERLPEVALVKWLAEAGDGQLTEESCDPVFVERLSRLTDGYPLYLSYLIVDLVEAKKAGQDPDAILAGTPKGFTAYVRGQARRISQTLGREREVRDLFVLLAVARYPLLESEVSQLTSLDEFDLDDLPPGATRWFNITRDSDGERSYSLAHARLAWEFEKAWPRSAGNIHTQLLTWCAEWETHHSLYALRHYAELLHQTKRQTALYTLARDEGYASCQQQELPAEPDLPLRTVRLALDTAATQESAGLMAEFLLSHARRVLVLRQFSPLEALRTLNGQTGMNRALQLADAHDNERRVLWHLLLSWVLTESGHQERARAVLEHLNRVRLPILSEPFDMLAFFLLVQLTKSQPVAGVALVDTTLGDDEIDNVSQRVLKDQVLTLALETASHILDDELKTEILMMFAKALIKAGMTKAGADTFALALEMTGSIGDERLKVMTLGEIAAAQFEVGLTEAASGTFALAVETARGISDRGGKELVLRKIAATQAAMGDFDGALETADGIIDEGEKAKVLQVIVVAQANVGDFGGALETAGDIREEGRKVVALREIVAAQAAVGDFGGALEVADRIGNEGWKAPALWEIASAQAEVGDFGEAQEVAGCIGDKSWKAAALWKISAGQAEAGLIEAASGTFTLALETAGGISNRRWKAAAMRKIATAQARAGLTNAASSTFALALESAGGISDRRWKVEALREIAAAQAAMGDFGGALESVDGIGNERLKVAVLREIAAAQAVMGDFEGALETADGIDDEDLKVVALRVIAAAQAAAGLTGTASGTFTLALETAGDIGDERLKASALGEIAAAQIEVGFIEAASGTFAMALETADGIDDEGLKVKTLADIAAAQTAVGNFDGALRAADGISSKSWMVKALLNIVAAQIKAGLTEAASDAIAQTFGVDRGIGDKRQKATAMLNIATAQTKVGDFGEALDTARSIGDERLKVMALGEIAAAQAAMGDFDGALETAGSIDVKKWKTAVLGEIAATQAEVGLTEAASGTFALAFGAARGMGDRRQKATALGVIAAAQARSGLTEAASGTFALALETAGSIDDRRQKATVLGKIAAAQAEVEFIEAALGTFALALQVAGNIGYGSQKVEALGEILGAQVGAGLTEAASGTFALALEAAGGIGDERLKAVALREIAAAQAMLGDFDRGLEMAGTIEDEEQKSAALRAIAVAQVKSGLGAQAVRTASLILANLDQHLPAIALTLIQAGDKKNFWQLLPICANVPEAVLRTCGVIAFLYPEQASDVANVVINQS